MDSSPPPQRQRRAIVLGWFEVTLIGAALAVVALLLWAQSSRLDVTQVSNIAFHAELTAVGFDAPRQPGRAILPWAETARAEGAIQRLMSHVNLTPAALALAPHADLVSLQSSIHAKQPMLNSIVLFSGTTADLWILRQRQMLYDGTDAWHTYGIVVDHSTESSTASYFEVFPTGLLFSGEKCFECHASGPRALRPLRDDLILNRAVADDFNRRIEGYGAVATYFPDRDRASDHGSALTLGFCASCHGIERGLLYRRQAESIRSLVAVGAMPREGRLTSEQLAELDAWLAGSRR